jgi:quinol monooxygenase YgiN
MLKGIARAGQAAGAVHHVFAGGDGEVLVIDEWSDEAAFQKFFDSQPDIPKIMQAAGAKGAPEITVYRKLAMPDEF